MSAPPDATPPPGEPSGDLDNLDTNRSELHSTPGMSQTFEAGDRVRCERAEPARGSWARFAGREGVVVSVNVSRSVNPKLADVVEFGVDLDSDGRADAWFRPDELAVIGTPQATSVRRLAANGGVGQ